MSRVSFYDGVWVVDVGGDHLEYAVSDGDGQWSLTCGHNLSGHPPGGGCESEPVTDPSEIDGLEAAVTAFKVATWHSESRRLPIELHPSRGTATDSPHDPFPIELYPSRESAADLLHDPFPIELK